MLPTATTIILLAATLFFIGLIIGWMFSNSTEATTIAKLKALVAVAVVMVWITATIADIIVEVYTVSPLLHALMGGIVGYFFTDEGIQFNIGGDQE